MKATAEMIGDLERLALDMKTFGLVQKQGKTSMDILQRSKQLLLNALARFRESKFIN